jgi:hypothetical protein
MNVRSPVSKPKIISAFLGASSPALYIIFIGIETISPGLTTRFYLQVFLQ